MKKRIIIPVAAALVLLAVFLGFGTFCRIVDGRIYPRNPEQLDLRGKSVSAEHYEALRRAMPDCELLWDIPFQGERYPMDTRQLQVSSLSDADVEAIALFAQLEAVDARQCRDYPQIAQLQLQYPQLSISCAVKLGTRTYYENAEGIWVSSLTEEELEAIACLRNLKKAVVNGGVDITNFDLLQAYCRENGVAFSINLGTGDLPEDTRTLTLPNATGPQINLLSLLNDLETLHLKEPRAPMEKITQLMQQLPDTAITWEKTVMGMTFPGDAEELDLSPVLSKSPDDAARGGMTAWDYCAQQHVHGDKEDVPSAVKVSQYHPLPDRIEDTRIMLEEIEKALPYFPELKQVVLCGARLNNLAVSEFREAHREGFKLVWTVQCGSVATRTDTAYFMPTKFHVYYFSDEDAYNLRYCEDIISLDIGHMAVHDISFVKNMPNLKYLILAHTGVRDISALSTCKNLVFLEVDWTAVQDLTPLLGCTALEDLNVGKTGVDLSPLKQMTWLKNLWIMFRGGSAWELSQALPNTKVMASGNATVASGWRRLPNYYAMRDELHMYYMTW